MRTWQGGKEGGMQNHRVMEETESESNDKS